MLQARKYRHENVRLGIKLTDHRFSISPPHKGHWSGPPSTAHTLSAVPVGVLVLAQRALMPHVPNSRQCSPDEHGFVL